jgi:hypothetical protein
MSTKQDTAVGLGAEVISDWWREGETRRTPAASRQRLRLAHHLASWIRQPPDRYRPTACLSR